MSARRARPRQTTMLPGGEFAGAGQVAAKPCEAGNARRHCARDKRASHGGQDIDFALGESEPGGCFWRNPIEHGDPEDAPTQDGEQRDEISQALRGSQFRRLGPAARLQDFVVDLDRPAHGIPAALGNRFREAADRKIGDELPVDLLARRRRVRLPGMNNG